MAFDAFFASVFNNTGRSWATWFPTLVDHVILFFWITSRQSENTGRSHVKYKPLILEMLENVLHSDILVGLYGLGVFSLSVVTVRAELDHTIWLLLLNGLWFPEFENDLPA